MFLDHPTITATDSHTEPQRLERLQRVLGYAMALADTDDHRDMPGKLTQIHDHKGTLIVFWHEPPLVAERDYFNRAWASSIGAGANTVEHEY